MQPFCPICTLGYALRVPRCVFILVTTDHGRDADKRACWHNSWLHRSKDEQSRWNILCSAEVSKVVRKNIFGRRVAGREKRKIQYCKYVHECKVFCCPRNYHPEKRKRQVVACCREKKTNCGAWEAMPSWKYGGSRSRDVQHEHALIACSGHTSPTEKKSPSWTEISRGRLSVASPVRKQKRLHSQICACSRPVWIGPKPPLFDNIIKTTETIAQEGCRTSTWANWSPTGGGPQDELLSQKIVKHFTSWWRFHWDPLLFCFRTSSPYSTDCRDISLLRSRFQDSWLDMCLLCQKCRSPSPSPRRQSGHSLLVSVSLGRLDWAPESKTWGSETLRSFLPRPTGRSRLVIPFPEMNIETKESGSKFVFFSCWKIEVSQAYLRRQSLCVGFLLASLSRFPLLPSIQ